MFILLEKYCSNYQINVHLAKNHVYQERSKYIDVKQVISKDIVEIKKIGTANNPADMLIKPI